MTPDEWFATGRIERLLDFDVFVIDSGATGRPVVFLIHGFPTSSWDWAEIWPLLSADYRLVALDLAGFGFTSKPNPHCYTIHEQADLCEALIDRLGLDRIHVLAHDYGDTVAQELLARQNESDSSSVSQSQRRGRWQSVCFLNGGLFPETHKARPIQKLLASPVGPLVGRLSTQRTFDRSFSAVFGEQTRPTREQLDRFWQLILHNDGKHVFHNLIGYMRERIVYRKRWVGALCDAKIPVALINGSADPVSGVHMIDRYRAVVGTRHPIVQLPRIGHYPQVEAPTDVATAYRRFVATTPP